MALLKNQTNAAQLNQSVISPFSLFEDGALITVTPAASTYNVMTQL